MLRLRFLFPTLMFAAIAVAAGCGGGGSASFVSAPPTPTPTPHAGPTTLPVGPSPQVVSLTGGGYTLTFTVPPLTVGSTTTMNATLQTTLPNGVNVPQGGRMQMTRVKPLASTFGGLAYLIVSSSATVGFSSAPSFQFTVPSGTIPSGQNAYLLFWDPYVGTINGWTNLLGPGTVSGNTVTFNGVQTGVSLKANTEYIYALAVTTSVVPTATPAPTPTGAPTSGPTNAPTATPSPGPTPALCPAPTANTFPMSFANNTRVSGPIRLYVGAGTSFLIDATSGTMQTVPAGQPAPSFTLPPSGCVNLPPATSARIYVVLNGAQLNYTSGSYPDAWDTNQVTPTGGGANAATTSAVWDLLEYTWKTASSGFNIDVTQVDAIGIPISFQAVNSSGSPAASALYGMKPYAISNMYADLQTLGSPWTQLVQQTGTSGVYRIVSPQHAQNIAPDQPTAAPGSPPPTATPPPTAPGANSPLFPVTNYWNPIVRQVWQTYQGSNFLHLNYPQFGDAYGVVDPSTNLFNFYTTPSATGTPIAQIAFPTTWAVFNNAGAFNNNSGSTPPSSGNPPAPNAATFIGRALVVSIERGTLPYPPGASSTQSQPFCNMSDWQFFYGGSLTQGGTIVNPNVVTNWYSALLHKYGQAPVPGLPGLSYGFPDDDECQNGNQGLYDPDYTQSYTPGEQWNVILNPF